jgi:hypothetical protein
MKAFIFVSFAKYMELIKHLNFSAFTIYLTPFEIFNSRNNDCLLFYYRYFIEAFRCYFHYIFHVFPFFFHLR